MHNAYLYVYIDLLVYVIIIKWMKYSSFTSLFNLNVSLIISLSHIIIRRPASALLDKLLCPPGPGGPAAAG